MLRDILIIENKEEVKQDIIKILEKDFNIYRSNLNDSFQIVEKNNILCILDYTDDINTIIELKKSSLTELIPVIVISLKIDYKMVRNYVNAGAYDFVELSSDKKILNLRINEAIDVLSHPRSLIERPTFDRLCEIYNEDTLLKEVRKRIDNRLNNEHFYMVIFDINKYSMIHYFFGLKYAEDVLRYISKLLTAESLIFDITYGRLSEDFFAFLLNGNDSDLNDIISNIKNGIKEFNLEYNIELTFGVYEVTNYSLDIQEMLSFARLAAKKIKGIIGPLYLKYDDKLGEDVALEQNYISSFDNALKNNEFVIYLQPKYDIILEKIVGAEALVRWGKNGSIISPGEFIPIFERNGLIDKLDRYVWEETVKYIRWRMDNKLPLFGISVNVSRVFLSMNTFIDDIINLVEKYNVPKKYLELEITESIFSDVSLIKDTVMKLRKSGFKILMDDFGSGYSGLNVLKDVEFDAIKIDLKFFSRNDKKSQDIIKSVLDIAHAIDIPAIAEGVETYEYIELLRKYGCNYAQGFYYSKPLCIEEFNKLCKKDCIPENTPNLNHLNIHHIEEAIAEFLDIAKDYASIEDSDINRLLEKYRVELNVDAVYINIASADGDNCIFTNVAYKDKAYDLTGLSAPITLEQYISQCMLYDDEGLSEIPGIPLEGRPFKSILYYGLTRGNYTDGTIGFINYKKAKKWTLAERRALKMLGRTLHLVVYRKRNDIIRAANNKKQNELRLAYEEISKAHLETNYFLSLILSAIKGISVRIIKYNFTDKKGCYYKPVDNKPYIVEDNTVFDVLCEFIDNAIEKPNINVKEEIDNLIPGQIKYFEIKSYDCLGQNYPDKFLHSTSIRLQILEKNGERTLIALLIDNTELIRANYTGMLEANKLKELLISIFTEDFIDLTKIELDTGEIHKFSDVNGQIEYTKLSDDWNKVLKFDLSFVVEDDIREKLYDELQYDSLLKLEPYKPLTYKYRSRYEMKDEPRNFLTECKLILNSDNSKSIAIYTTDISKSVLLENRLNEKIKTLEHLAYYDTLTNLNNRLGLKMSLEKIKDMVNINMDQYLIMLDADYFKDINDTYGHLEGDKALKNIAEVLDYIKNQYKGFVYRLGGDEFVLLLNYPKDKDINLISTKINERLANIDSKYNIEITIGVAKANPIRIENANLEYIDELIDVADLDLRNNKILKKVGR